ncbi:glucose-1-dehydrogenase [Stutzerimonas nosocomialis]|uniref:Glucose-1-dehydrogenase n=1 Tax=Stutzerimonas nosocomialis TaxID=1056496 RepID=A0A5R9QEH7_9GAMM|nr:glucose 1-dehydrogenase [Stutzerimonas nosocomialis]TLX57917.1 glucose-1-dehydrogenase [Stutzerimonas nosocomialis]TLX59773.1 glucose-1-dehydrogenase [Stutzerimonas nosocomialis]TLX63153.1 glucose-1-dehydrogenase [Stutzerimonas nosocomialis]
MRLENKVALVTGSTQGIGRGIAVRLAQEGADIVVTGRSEDEGRETAEEVRALGRRACVIPADLAEVSACRRLVEEAIRQMGRLDILVNNAGMQKNAAFLDAEPQDYDQILNVNLRAPFFITQAFARHLVETGRGGRIVNNSSVHEELPMPNFTDYCASKGGLKMMMRNLAIELAPLGITINNVAPGAIETPINRDLMNRPDKLANLLGNIPANRLGQPRDVAGAVAFLVSDDADYITGTTLFVDGGLLWNYSEQ